MRLTDEILILSDDCMSELVGKALALGARGNFGLFPGKRPFSVSLDINGNDIDVVSLNCLGVTRDGSLIDIQYDTDFTNTFDTGTVIHNSKETAAILCVSLTEEWRDTNDGMCEPVYSYSTIEENSPLPANALPVARLVYDEYCWRVDDIDFVPPCLFLSACVKYETLYSRFGQLLNNMDAILPHKLVTGHNDALKIFWPIVQQLAITIDKEKDSMTPMTFLANVQKCVSGFLLACSLDEYINLGEAETFAEFVHLPYNYKTVYQAIRDGVELCSSIYVKINAFDAVEPESKSMQAPTLSSDQYNQSTKTGMVRLLIGNVPEGAELYYSLDGSEPSILSKSGKTITIDPHFKANKSPEPDKQMTLKLRYILDGLQSDIGTYQINVHKDYKSYICI